MASKRKAGAAEVRAVMEKLRAEVAYSAAVRGRERHKMEAAARRWRAAAAVVAAVKGRA